MNRRKSLTTVAGHAYPELSSHQPSQQGSHVGIVFGDQNLGSIASDPWASASGLVRLAVVVPAIDVPCDLTQRIFFQRSVIQMKFCTQGLEACSESVHLTSVIGQYHFLGHGVGFALGQEHTDRGPTTEAIAAGGDFASV